MQSISILDIVALAVFITAWLGSSYVIDNPRSAKPRVSRSMNRYRILWMQNMVQRELRMVDSTIQGSLLNGVAFFASTSILLVGGLVTVLGATDRAIELLAELPIVTKTSKTLWELKILTLIVVFTYAFFKFAWCYRIFIYVVILIGAAPHHSHADQKASTEFANRTANLHDLGAQHFNRGLRAYMFALAGLSWFLHPVALIFSAILVLLVLYRREFKSRTLACLGDVPPV